MVDNGNIQKKESSSENISNFYFKLNLDYLLKLNKIKKNEFAREIGVSKQTVFDWLKKDPILNTHLSLKIAKYFKISVEELYLCNLQLAQDFDSTIKFEYLNKIQAPFYIIDLEAKLTFANHAFCHLLGFLEQDFNSRICSDIIHPDDFPQLKILMKRSFLEKKLFSQVDLRFVFAKQGFIWINNLCTSSYAENKIFVFAFPLQEKIEKPTFEKFHFEEFVMKELEKIQLNSFLDKKLNFVSRLSSEILIKTDRNFLKCLLRSMFNQFQYIEFESDSNEIFLSSRQENGKILLSATINCTINSKTPDLSRVKKVADIIGASVEENRAGNLYSFYIAFPV